MKRMYTKYGYRTREAMAKMTDNDAWAIISELNELEFPRLFFELGLQFALFRTYGIPHVSRLLARTAQLSTVENAPKRYADTEVLLTEIYSNPSSSSRTLEAFGRMNYLHGVYRNSNQISDADMLYTLALFAREPLLWISRYEWRQPSDLERCAMGTFHKSMGDAMQIPYSPFLPSAPSSTSQNQNATSTTAPADNDADASKTEGGQGQGWTDGLHFLSELSTWAESYEAAHMLPDPLNHKIANETTSLLLFAFPESWKPFGRKCVSALMDPLLRRAMLYPDPPPFIPFLLQSVLYIRKLFLQYLALPRPGFMRKRKTTSQPNEHGRYNFLFYANHPFYVKPSVWNRWGPEALVSRLIGCPVPAYGVEGERYGAVGYKVGETGPKGFLGKGGESARGTVERLRGERVEGGGCPFRM
ncbi:MAG: hypothetical protein Q9227_007181 [Pyrenula ochraceoflavens]